MAKSTRKKVSQGAMKVRAFQIKSTFVIWAIQIHSGLNRYRISQVMGPAAAGASVDQFGGLFTNQTTKKAHKYNFWLLRYRY
jgi:hypothetical protein